MEDAFSDKLLFFFAVFCIVYPLSGRPIYRKGTGAPFANQLLARIAMFGLGLALLLFWISERYSK